ncbi:MAG: BspA family leucine-rich repeat surface protein [Flavobacteriaceae bacterium]
MKKEALIFTFLFFITLPLYLIANNGDSKLSVKDFVTTWDTENYGVSGSSSIKIPAYEGFFNYKVDWDNDGVFDQFNIKGVVTYNYGKPGIYTIRISGDFPRIAFNNEGDKLKLIEINQWGNQEWTSMRNAFWGCENLEGLAKDVPNLSNLTNLDGMFESASSFNQNINNWDTSTVNNMAGMFAGARTFNQPLNKWNTSNVMDMSFMFSQATLFNQNINQWNTSKVRTMRAMFQKAISFNKDLNHWNTISVIDMKMMFSQAINFNSKINDWNVENVKTFSLMFQGDKKFNQDLSNWNTVNAIDMKSMFILAHDFDQNLSKWNITNLKFAQGMFSGGRLSVENYDALLIGWSSQNVKNQIIFGAGSSKYCSGKSSRTKMISNGFIIEDAGLNCENDFVEK